MRTSRVILANEPSLLRGMLRRAIARAPGLEVVGEVTDPAKLLPLVNQSKAQWVIVSIWPEGPVPRTVQSLLLEHSSLGILGMSGDGSRAKIMCNNSAEQARDGLSLDDLIAILQSEEVNCPGHS